MLLFAVVFCERSSFFLFYLTRLHALVFHRELADSASSYRYLPRVSSPLSIDDPIQRARQQNLIARFNDSFSVNRLDAMDTLRRYSDDHENNQRIIFVAITVSGGKGGYGSKVR